jgi:methylglyoxal synthase
MTSTAWVALAGVPVTARPEELDVDAFIRLAKTRPAPAAD